MPDFTDTLIACQQMSLLGADPAGAVEQAKSDFDLVGVAAHLTQLRIEMLEHGHPATLAAAEDCTSAKLTWRLPGAHHPRDRYTLAIEVAAGGATARFVGPARSTALILQTRNFNPDALHRWSATFIEWALTSREAR
ncbi:hypothetical protein [Methylibium petroleiphilum]|uniref:Uncharacterized protein n=1 Tax=Methylibium petroleiphilum (strain ATCC BAA-1232 / LMG 22953 / PM1) TaxID=420662 RepID=A2SMW8_METPP|nr:hypothetical protein [Methylibium petroleiphilum]ABM96907.1 hypothetical protein Mpe_B0128 [Methylibium petroleiphilum PM1]